MARQPSERRALERMLLSRLTHPLKTPIGTQDCRRKHGGLQVLPETPVFRISRLMGLTAVAPAGMARASLLLIPLTCGKEVYGTGTNAATTHLSSSRRAPQSGTITCSLPATAPQRPTDSSATAAAIF